MPTTLLYNTFVTLHKRTIYILFLLLLGLLSACTAPTPREDVERPWQQSDLRALEAPNIDDPQHDLIAAYARLTPTDLELRFDLLGSPDPFDYDLYIAYQSGPQADQSGQAHFPLETQPGLAWDLAESFPARGLPWAFRPDGTPAPIRPRIIRLSVQDAAVVRLSLSDLRTLNAADPSKAAFQIFLTRPGEGQVVDSLGPLRVDGPAPSVQANVLLAFWNTLPSATPAQALRRWDGAHTGPYGQRHGLEVLLKSAQRTQTPLVLLDLKQPDSLAALEALGGLPQVQQMVKDGLVLLPDVAYGDPLAAVVSGGYSRQAGLRRGFTESPFLYGAVSGSLPAETRVAFAQLPSADGPRMSGNTRLIPLPGSLNLPSDPAEAAPQTNTEAGAQTITEADEEGLTLPVRLLLLAAALSNQPGRLVSLGGDLPRSPWGDSLIASPALDYLAGHPWLHAVNSEELLKLPVTVSSSANSLANGPDCPNLLCQAQAETAEAPHAEQNRATIRAAIQSAPAGLFRDLAWQAYLHLTIAETEERVQTLRAGQLGEIIGPLLAAADWNAAPAQSAQGAAQPSCDRDLNWDGAPECILASQNSFLVLDPRGGRLVYAAARINSQPVQIIAPRAQYALGLGDPLELRPERGSAGDPQGIPGAFAPPLDPYNAADWQLYTVETQPGQVTFTRSAGGLRKIYRLNEQGIEISVSGASLSETSIPLALVDVGAAQFGDYGRYQAVDNPPPDTWVWRLAPSAGIKTAAEVQIRAQNAALDVQSFSDSRPQLLKPEDPNLAYPPGHFVPFPLAVLSIKPVGAYTVEIRVQKYGQP